MDFATLGIRVDSSQVNTATRDLNTLSSTGAGVGPRIASSMSTLETSVTRATRAVTGFVSAFGLYQVGRLASDILATNRSMETLRMELTAVEGSIEGSRRAFNFLSKFADETPFEVDGLTKAFVSLRNFGINPTKEVMDAITNQASKLGGSQEVLTGITIALGQAWGKGKLQGQEILQLINQGVPVWDLLSQATGKNTAELQKMSEKGEITRVMIEKLIMTMGEAAKGSNALAMDTLNGKISTLADSWHHWEDALLQDKSEGVIKSIVSSITGTLNILTRNMTDSLDAQIAHAEARINTFNKMNLVAKGVTVAAGFIGTFGQDYSINDQKTKLASLKELKIKQDAADAEVALTKKTAFEKTLAADNIATGSKKIESASNKVADAIKHELDALTDQHNKLAMSERDYEANRLASLGMSAAQKSMSLAIWDANKALEAQQQGIDAGKTAMDAEIERYQKLTQSANEYKYSQLLLSGVSPGNAVEIVSKSNQNDFMEVQKTNAELIKSGEIQGKFNERLATMSDLLKAGTINEIGFKSEMDKMAQSYNANFIDPVEKSTNKMNSFFDSAAKNMQTSLGNFLFDPFKDGLVGMADGFLQTLRKMAADALAAQIMNGLMGPNFSSGGGAGNISGGWLEKGIGLGASLLGSFGGGGAGEFNGTGPLLSFGSHHAGGIVGSPSSYRSVHSSVFDNAPRFHNGGLVGGEVPIIAKKGERVLTEEQQRNMGGTTNITVNVASGTPADVRRSAAQGAREALGVMSGAQRYA